MSMVFPALRRRRVPWLQFALLAGFILLSLVAAVLGGLAAGSGSTRTAVLMAGAVGALVLVAMRQELLLGVYTIFVLLVVGTVGYFSQVEVVFWVPYLIGGLLLLKFLTLAIGSRRGDIDLPPVVLWLLLFWFVGLTSGVINGLDLGNWVVAIKDYLMAWGALFILAITVRQPKTYFQLWKLVLLVAVLQVPLCLYQYIVVGGRLVSEGRNGWDAVSGTMGGSESGGASAAVGFLCVTAIVVALSLWRRTQLKGFAVSVVVAAGLFCLALTEVKAALYVFLPLGMMLLYRRWLLSQPVRFIGVMFTAALVIGLLMTAHDRLHYQRAASVTGLELTPMESLNRAFSLEVRAEQTGMRTSDLGRTALLLFWVETRKRHSWQETLFGHGPAATKVGRFAVGEVVRKYPEYGLQKTAISVLLWSFGLVGAFVFAAMLTAGAWYSWLMASKPGIPPEQAALLEAGGVVLLLFCISLFYSRLVLELPPMSLLAMLCMGQATYWWRVGKQVERSRRLQTYRGATFHRRAV
jgi:hypothetical protein